MSHSFLKKVSLICLTIPFMFGIFSIVPTLTYANQPRQSSSSSSSSVAKSNAKITAKIQKISPDEHTITLAKTSTSPEVVLTVTPEQMDVARVGVAHPQTQFEIVIDPHNNVVSIEQVKSKSDGSLVKELETIAFIALTGTLIYGYVRLSNARETTTKR